MNDFSQMSEAELLRAAIAEERADWNDHSEFALGQLYAGIVAGHEDLEKVWQEETAPGQVELDIHLDGPAVTEHSTNARLYALFVENLNKTCRQIVRDRTGHYGDDLLVRGAAPGSVRLVLQAPDPTPFDGPEPALAIEESGERFQSTPQSEALRNVARLLTNASDDEPAIAGEVRDLPPAARNALREAVQVTRREGWDIEGAIRQRGAGVDTVRLTSRGAAILAIELEAHRFDSRKEWVNGKVDGYRRSLGSFYFSPAGGGRPYAVSAAPDLIRQSAALAADPDTPVRAYIEMVWAVDDRSRSTTSRTLLAIEAAPPSRVGL